MIWGVAGLRPNFFSSGRIFLAELAQESLRDLAAVLEGTVAVEPSAVRCVRGERSVVQSRTILDSA